MESSNRVFDLKKVKPSKLGQLRRESFENSRPSYERVGNFLAEKQKRIERIPNDKLGNVSHEADYYFIETEEAHRHTKYFLSQFYSKKENVAAMINQQHSKYNDTDKSKPLPASCFNFVVISVQISPTDEPKKYCLIAISGDTKYGLETEKLISPTISQCNKEQGEIEYIYISGDIRNFNHLLQRLGAPSSGVFKPCAEKFIGSAILKLCSIFKENFQILGGYNCGAYPFMRGMNYGFEGSADKTVVPPMRENKIIRLGNGIQIDVIPCCSNCADNKKAMFSSWKGIQDYNKDTESPPTSPLVNNVITPTTLPRNVAAYSSQLRRQRSLEFQRKLEEKESNTAGDESGEFKVIDRRRTQRSQHRSPLEIREIQDRNSSFTDKNEVKTDLTFENSRNQKKVQNDKHDYLTLENPSNQQKKLTSADEIKTDKQADHHNVATTRRIITQLRETTIEDLGPNGEVLKKKVKKNVRTEEVIVNTPIHAQEVNFEPSNDKRAQKNKKKRNRNKVKGDKPETENKPVSCVTKLVSVASALSIVGVFAAYHVLTNTNSACPSSSLIFN